MGPLYITIAITSLILIVNMTLPAMITWHDWRAKRDGVSSHNGNIFALLLMRGVVAEFAQKANPVAVAALMGCGATSIYASSSALVTVLTFVASVLASVIAITLDLLVNGRDL